MTQTEGAPAVPRVLTLTMNPSIDLQTETAQVVPNRKLACSEARHVPGGGGIAVARALRRLGVDALALFPVGGPTGARLTELLEAEGVATATMPVEGETRATVLVTESSSGNLLRFIPEGAALAEPEWRALLDAIETLRPTPEIIVASGTLPPGVPEDFFGRLSTVAARLGSRLIVDTSGMALRHAVGPGTFLLKPNLAEFRALAGSQAFSDFFLEGAARALVSAGKAKTVVLSMGAGGALCVSESGARRFRAPVVKVESRFGAGDSMVAGIVSGLLRGLVLEEAVLYGIAAGSAAVMNPGTELCRLDDVERLFAEMHQDSAGAPATVSPIGSPLL